MSKCSSNVSAHTHWSRRRLLDETGEFSLLSAGSRGRFSVCLVVRFSALPWRLLGVRPCGVPGL